MIKKALISLLVVGLAVAGIDKEAKESIDAFKKNIKTNKEMKNEAKKSVDSFYKEAMPYVKEWKKHIFYDEKTGKLIIKGDVESKEAKNKSDKVIGTGENEFLEKTDRIYIFISSSIPKQTLINYAKSIYELNLENRAVMVLRGCINGCKYIKPTLLFIRSILTEDGKNQKGLPVQIWIDPLLFRMYNINVVPCVVFAENVDTKLPNLSEALAYNLKDNPKYALSCGDWNLTYHLETLYKKTKNKKLKAILDKINKLH